MNTSMTTTKKYTAYIQIEGWLNECWEDEFDTYEEAKAKALDWFREQVENNNEYFCTYPIWAGVIGPGTDQIEGDIVADNADIIANEMKEAR